MTYTTNGPAPWPVPPDWSIGVRESLSWLTDVLRSNRTGYTQHRRLRLSPRRAFTFDVIADAQSRRVAAALLFDRGVKEWALPIWPDVQRTDAAIASGATIVPCRTSGFDFAVGGQAMLWRGVNQFEVAIIAAIAGDHLELQAPLASSWARGTRLYPVRAARVVDGSEEQAWTDDAGKRSVSFQLTGPSDWPGVLPLVLYRGFPVLDHRSDEGTDPTSSVTRQIEFVDEGTSLVSAFDLAGRAFRTGSHRWLANGRGEQAVLRSLLYGLAGRSSPLWVPSGAADLKLAQPIAAASPTIVVEWAGYALFGRQQQGRRDIRIELKNGTAYHRRITVSSQAGANEVLTLDSALGASVSLAQIRRISFMSLSTLASDDVEIEHMTDADGTALCNLTFAAVTDDV
ncbi:MAG: hypothetical protein DI562_12015 [Stenotrophomonas acidaminiphila]|nr:MAG: hypothetical protein DI562_12015 [Stenotrophomonas acidaminiphila]